MVAYLHNSFTLIFNDLYYPKIFRPLLTYFLSIAMSVLCRIFRQNKIFVKG